MLSYVWIVDNELAVAPLPTLGDVDVLSQVFDAVVVLIEPHEAWSGIDHYLNKWVSKGVDVYYAPTPDFHPVDLLELHSIVQWINERVERGYRVLVHCHGGVGRSGMVATAYLITRGFEFVEAVMFVRSRRPGALEAKSQHRVVEDYSVLLKNIDRELFNKHVFFVKENSDKPLWRHLSKTLQLLVELHDHLEIRINDKTIYATLHHCFSNEQLDRLVATKVLETSVISLLRGDSTESTLIKLAHTLDYRRDSRVVYTESFREEKETIIELYCDTSCSDILAKTHELVEILRNNKQFSLREAPYEW